MSVGFLPEHNLLLIGSIIIALFIFIIVEKGMAGLTISCTNELLRKSWQLMEILSFFLLIFLSCLFWFSRDVNCTIFDATSANIGFSISGILIFFLILFIIISGNIYIQNKKVSEQDSKECGNSNSEVTKSIINLLVAVSIILLLVMVTILGVQIYSTF